MKKTIKLTESELKTVITRIIEQAAGYDDFQVMYHHGSIGLKALMTTLKDLLSLLRSIIMIIESDSLEYNAIVELLYKATDLISNINVVMKTVFKDFTDREVIKKGKLLGRALESYKEKLFTFMDMGEELVTKDMLLDKLTMLTDIVVKRTDDYAVELSKYGRTFKSRLEFGKDEPKGNFN
jgi:hypothetical protein